MQHFKTSVWTFILAKGLTLLCVMSAWIQVGCGSVAAPPTAIGTVLGADTATGDTAPGDGTATGDSLFLDATATADAADANPGDAAPACVESVCAVLGLHCNPFTGHCIACLGPEQCTKGQSCVDNHCVSSSGCKGQPATCSSLNTAAVCDPVTDTWTSQPCAADLQCVDGKCLPAKCPPLAKGCDNNLVIQCSADGTQLEPIQDCTPSKQVCQGGACITPSCTPGQPVCIGNQVMFCDPSGNMTPMMSCGGGGSYCVNGYCQVAPCAPGGVGCAGTDAVQCSASDGSYKVTQGCAALGKICDAGQCVTPVCTANTLQCSGSLAQACAANGSSWITLSDCAAPGGPPGYCEAGQCVPMPCNAGAQGCSGGNVVLCGAKTFTLVEDCKAQGLSCEKDQCKAIICQPNKYQCDGTKLVFCNASGTSTYLEEDCAQMGNGMTCIKNTCKKMPCAVGKLGCVGTQVVACDASSYAVQQDCAATGQVCSSGACVAPICNSGDSVCDGSKVMNCQGGLSWQQITDCAQQGLNCVSGACVQAPCGPGGIGCEAGKVVQCDASGKSWSVAEDCPSTGKLCVAGACKAPICAPQFTSCDNNKMMVCAADGSGYTSVAQDCTAMNLTCVQGYCVSSVCSVGAVGCVGTQQALCATDGLSWTQSPCPIGQGCSSGSCQKPPCSLPSAYGADAIWLAWQDLVAEKGCDLNGDSKPDNAMGTWAGLFITGAMAPYPGQTPFVMAVTATGFNTTGKPFTVEVLPTIPPSAGMGCNPFMPGTQTCKALAEPSAYDPGTTGLCAAKNHWTDAVVNGTQFKAGGNGQTLWLPLQSPPLPSYFKLKDARLVAEVSAGAPWQAASNGHLCGWVSQADLDLAIATLPKAVFNSPGMDANMFKTQIMQQIKPDIDSDGNGTLDAYSIALPWTGMPLQLGSTQP